MKKTIHCNERADDFPIMKDGLNIRFKGMHLIAERMMSQWMLRHSLVKLLNLKDLKSEIFRHEERQVSYLQTGIYNIQSLNTVKQRL